MRQTFETSVQAWNTRRQAMERFELQQARRRPVDYFYVALCTTCAMLAAVATYAWLKVLL